ncbi:Uncharacterised protein [Citrobacter amalonaticus]|nr:Uncharacterised protein [Citrobacter amalonaticus]
MYTTFIPCTGMPQESIMNPEKREYDLAGLLSLIQLESELTIAVASS